MDLKEHMDFVADVIAGLQVQHIDVFGQRVAVVRDPSEEKTAGGLYIPEEGKRKEPRGTIVAVGNKVEDEDGVDVGDRVMYTKYAPIHFSIVLPDGRKADLELLHVSDIYMGWKRYE
jgi:chaperonin GroES